ncbi:paa1, partial [Symbiodinium microadriaticum]
SVDDEDDVILAIAENIGDLRFHVGGERYYYTLLEPIELLAIVEEAAVRDAAVKAVEPVIQGMPDEDLLTYFVPFVSKLASKD